MTLIKTKHGDYHEKIHIPLYRYNVYVVFAENATKAKAARFPELSEDVGDAYTLTVKDEADTTLIFEYNASPGIIAHEVWHAVRRLMSWIGAIDLENEVTAYHIDYLVDEIWDIKKQVNKARREEKIDGLSTVRIVGKESERQG